MVAPVVAAAGISALGSLVGGAMSRPKNQHRTRNNILRTVLDAKQAGVHPLFALGSSANYAPQWNSGGSDYGIPGATDAISRGIMAASASKQAEKQAGIASETREIDAEVARSVINRNDAAAEADRAQATAALANVNATGLGRAGNDLDFLLKYHPALAARKPAPAKAKTVPAQVIAPEAPRSANQAGGARAPYIKVRTAQGGEWRLPDPNIADPDSLAGAALFVNALLKDFVGKPGGKALFDYVQRIKNRNKRRSTWNKNYMQRNTHKRK